MADEKMRDIADLQTAWNELENSGKMTKKNICDTVIPFRDKYNLKDSDALRIARNEVSIADMIDLLNMDKEE